MMNKEIQFFIKSSNDLNILSDSFIDTMQRNQPGIFTPVYIVTQTEGMNNWLREKIASRIGISANIVFLKPNDLVNDIYIACGGKYSQTLSATDLSWMLYEALNDERIQKKHPSVVRYFLEEGIEDNTRRMELARKLSDLFDQYQVYREDILQKWEAGELATAFDEEKWQKDLWCMAREKAGEKFPDKTVVKKFILNKLKDPAIVDSLANKIPRIYIFGTVLLTEFHRDLLLHISQHIPVHIYLPNPAPGIYWYEDKSKKEIFYSSKKGRDQEVATASNPLLLNWGKLIQNTFLMLFSNDDVINLYEPIEKPFQTDSLLHKVQFYFSENNIPAKEDYFTAEELQDGSITIQSCASPIREVESLYNYLVRLVDLHPSEFSARDIIVQVTDINLYASYIRAVFDNAPYRFRYTIADESYISSDSLSKALYEILTIDADNFTSERILQLLDFSCLRKHFRINNIDSIRKAVDDSNIRHSISGDPANDSNYVSWKYGIQRIMYGLCISGSPEIGSGPESFYPLDSIEGAVATDIIHFIYLVEKLIYFVEERKPDKSVKEWISYISEILHQLIFDEQENDSEEYRLLIRQIENTANIQEFFLEKIPYQVFLKQFLPQLRDAISEYRFSRGGITFCSLIPMRSIPFNVVAMLGLDLEKFPRKNSKTGFDLMVKSPRAGDRSLKINDKHLFLETLLSAGNYLYLSYNGQNIKDNSTRPPSILIDEFLSFLESYSKDRTTTGKSLITRQPLHALSNLYGNKKGYYNYLIAPKEQVDILDRTPEPPEPTARVRWKDFLSFYRNPIKFYYNKVLYTWFEDQSYTLADSEIFELEPLEKWTLRKEWLLQDDNNLDAFIDLKIKTGALPLKNAGRMEMLKIEEEMKCMKEQFRSLKENQSESFDSFLVTLNNVGLEGTIDSIFGNKILIPCLSKNENKAVFQSYLLALITSVAGIEKDVVIISEKVTTANKISAECAKKYLGDLLAIYLDGLENMKFFFLDGGLSPDEIHNLTVSNWKKYIENKCKYDLYLKKEIGHGLIESRDAFETYKSIVERILQGFPDVFN